MQYSSEVYSLVFWTDGRLKVSVYRARTFGFQAGMDRPKSFSRTTHLSSQGQTKISARLNSSPKTNGPTMLPSKRLKASLILCCTFSFSPCSRRWYLLTEQKAPTTFPTTSCANHLNFNLFSLSFGISAVPVLNYSATYHEIKSLSAKTLSPWIRMGTLPSDFGSLPQALLQIYVNSAGFCVRLNSCLSKGIYFSSRASQARWANGQTRLQTSVSFGFNISFNISDGFRIVFKVLDFIFSDACTQLRTTEKKLGKVRPTHFVYYYFDTIFLEFFISILIQFFTLRHLGNWEYKRQQNHQMLINQDLQVV